MERKAYENLSASQTLVDLDDPCPNAATTRAYYAAYQAVWFKLEGAGIEVPVESGKHYFRHDEIGQQAQDAKLFNRQLAIVFENLRDARVRADYFQDDCTRDEALGSIREARQIVELLLGKEVENEP